MPKELVLVLPKSKLEKINGVKKHKDLIKSKRKATKECKVLNHPADYYHKKQPRI